jgi:hypothetical protein
MAGGWSGQPRRGAILFYVRFRPTPNPQDSFPPWCRTACRIQSATAALMDCGGRINQRLLEKPLRHLNISSMPPCDRSQGTSAIFVEIAVKDLADGFPPTASFRQRYWERAKSRYYGTNATSNLSDSRPSLQRKRWRLRHNTAKSLIRRGPKCPRMTPQLPKLCPDPRMT